MENTETKIRVTVSKGTEEKEVSIPSYWSDFSGTMLYLVFSKEKCVSIFMDSDSPRIQVAHAKLPFDVSFPVKEITRDEFNAAHAETNRRLVEIIEGKL